jgi:DNA gyrase subunit B
MPADAATTSVMFEMMLGDDLAGRKDFIAQYGHRYIDSTELS